MKISESWLREWVNPPVDTKTLAEQLTMAGLEVDSITPVAPEFTGVEIAEIVQVDVHPDADKLRVCQVDCGQAEKLQVVCGAPNARVGLKVPFAQVGAILPGGLQIKKTAIRGVESSGMLCAEEELGLAESSDGLLELPEDAPIGTDIRDYLALNNLVIEVDLTPNRGDCLSVQGVAREVAVINRVPLTPPDVQSIPAKVGDKLAVKLNAGKACSRYAGRVIRNIQTGAKSPRWLVDKLLACDVRSIDPVVDVTNYVMLELGQPMHAFDLAAIEGYLQVRMAKAAEKVALLDGTDVELSEDTLVIADANKALAVAGIMGGSDSAVSEETVDIFLESACFDPIAIAGKARKLGKHTDSSHRFERGVDPSLQVKAIERATALLLEIVGGESGPVIFECLDDEEDQSATIRLNKGTLKAQLAVEIPESEIETIFQGLGFEQVEATESGWVFKAPSWRFDMAIEADLIEEVARIYGYNNLPTTTPVASLTVRPREEGDIPLAAFREKLLARGYQEAITYSFVDPEVQRQITGVESGIPLTNPISADMAEMRLSLWPGLLAAVKSNLNRQHNRVRFFETGQRFIRSEVELLQDNVIAGVVTGSRYPVGWSAKPEPVDFYDVKGDVEALLGLCSGRATRFVKGTHPALHPGQCAEVLIDGKSIGYVGKLNPLVKKGIDLDQDVYLFELALQPLSSRVLPAFKEISKFPSISWDLAFTVGQAVPVGDMLEAAQLVAGNYVKELKVFDVYQGKGIENNRKSVAMVLTFQHGSRTLGDEEVQASVRAVVDELKQRFSASLRGEI